MGTYARRRPERLAEKLLAVREAFGDSQNGLIRRLGLEDEITQSDLSAFERGTREPPVQGADLPASAKSRQDEKRRRSRNPPPPRK